MEQLLINDEMNITIPEGFTVLSAEQIAEMNYIDNPPQFCMRNEEKHIIFSIAYKKTNRFFAALLSAKDIAGSMEKGLEGPMAQFGYELEGYTSRKVGGKASTGFGYNYQVDDVGMHGAAYSVKTKGTFYYLYAYIRQESREEGLKTVTEILDGISFR